MEELENVQREAQWVHTSITDEDEHFAHVLADLKVRDDLLYGAVAKFCARWCTNNAHVLSHLHQLYALEGYGGNPTPGKYCGAPWEQWSPHIQHGPPVNGTPSKCPPSSLPQTVAPAIEDLTRTKECAVALKEDNDDLDVDEDADGGVSLLVDHLANIAVVM